MTTIRKTEFRCPRGPMTWEQFEPWFKELLRIEFRKMDLRDEAQEPLAGRAVTLPVLNTHIGDEGRASSQKLLPLVNASNKLSVQSIQPLTAIDAGADATINVAAHNVTFGFGVLNYNAGSIAGLPYSTLHYVYTDDPNYEGGAVTYFATTNPLLVTANDGRYYLGKVTTPAATGGPTGGGFGGGGGGGGSQIP